MASETGSSGAAATAPRHTVEAKKVVVAGSAGCGKTALVQRAVANTFASEYHQTLGADLCVKTTNDRTKYTLNIWCLSGHERYRPLLEQFFIDANTVLLCFDMLSVPSFKELPFWYNEYRRNAPDALAVVVGMKADEADNIVVKVQDAMKQAKEWGLEFRAVSSKTGMNVNELFDHIMATMP
ncbi:hypothetical protein HDU85_001900 [Gaertneriomyces sp. JEL0708]|nr:hypothetical protein HDU85_001900 [Gaertneriomyces sp. JEL0708]